MKAKIHVTFNHAGLHRWNGAPLHRSYLGVPHRHLFKVEVTTEVDHDDRDIEFHDLLNDAQDAFIRAFDGIGYLERSCEHMARQLAEQLSARHDRWFSVSVWEDGECGSTVETEKKAPG